MTGHRRRAVALDWVVVGAGFAVLALAAAGWLAVDRRPPEWDHANHLERAVRCAGDLAARDWASILARSSFYPPLVTCAAGIAFRLAPSDVAAAQAVILGFLALGMAATYLLGRRLAGGAAGVAAALIFGTAPFVVFSALRFQLDLPLAAMVALALWVLLETDGFRRTGWSLALGLALGLGMLTKPPFALYVVPAFVIVAAGARGRRRVLNGLAALVVGVGLSLPWYGPRLLGILAQVATRSFKQAAESGYPDPLSWTGLAFYPSWLPVQFGVAATVGLLAGLVVAVGQRQWFALAALLAPFAVVELLQNKNLRYTLPLLPMAAVVAALPLARLAPRARAVAGGSLGVVAALQVSATLLGVPPGARVLGVPLALASPPVRADWRHRAILERLRQDSGGAAVTVSVVPNYDLFSVSNFRYYGLVDGLPFRFVRAWDAQPLGVEYMILKSGDQGPAWTEEKPRRILARLRDDAHLARVFPEIGRWELPDGSVATLRARRVPADHGAIPERVARAVEAAVRRQLAEVARDVEGLEVRVQWDRAILHGQVRRVEIAAASATVGELTRRDPALLRLRDARVVVEDLLVNPFSASRGGRLDPLDVGRLRIMRATLTAEDVRRFLHGLRRFRRAALDLEDGAIVLALAQPGPDVAARVRIASAPDRPFVLHAERVRLGGVPVPAALVDWVVRQYDPSPRIASRLPVPVEVGRITITREAIRITPKE